DGHGISDRVSKYLSENIANEILVDGLIEAESIPHFLFKKIKKMDGFDLLMRVQENENGRDPGSTAVISVLIGRAIFTAWVGDSEARIYYGYNDKVVNLTSVLHTPEDEMEYLRAKDQFEFVGDSREEAFLRDRTAKRHHPRLSGLGMTRSLGDFGLKRKTPKVIADPFVSFYVVGEKEIQKPRFLLLASDGLWDFGFDETNKKYLYANEDKSTWMTRSRFTYTPIQRVMDFGLATSLVAQACNTAIDEDNFQDDTTCIVVGFMITKDENKNKIVFRNNAYASEYALAQARHAFLKEEETQANGLRIMLREYADAKVKDLVFEKCREHFNYLYPENKSLSESAMTIFKKER